MTGKAQWPFRLQMPHSLPSVRLLHSANESWVKAEEKEPILDKIKTKDDQPLKILHHCGSRTVTESVWIQKQEEGTSPAQIWTRSMEVNA